MDPAALRDPVDSLVVSHTHETLVGFDPETLVLNPRLADEWEVGEGGRRHRFRLRTNPRFHDGRAVTARDVVFSLNRLVVDDPGTGYSRLLDAVAGFDPVHTLGTSSSLSGIRAVDARTVEFELTHPWYDFPFVLTHPATSIVPVGSAAQAPQGSGGFRLEGDLRRSSELELVRTSSSAEVSRIRLRFEGRARQAWRDFEDRELDLVEAPVGLLERAGDRYGTEGFRPLAAMVYLGFNLGAPTLADPRFRRSISVALDRSAVASDVYGGTLLPPSGMLPSEVSVGDCAGLCGFDEPRAKAGISALFGDSPPTLHYDYPAGQPNDALAGAIRTMLGEAGLEVVLRPHDVPGYADVLSSGGSELFHLGWVADYPLADWFLWSLFRSSSPDNYAGLNDPAIDAALAGARSIADRGERLGAYGRIERQVLEHNALIPLGQFRSHYVVRDGVQGLRVDPLGIARLGSIRLDEG